MRMPAPRLHLLVARAAPRILILRRGPSRVYHLVLWHTDTDTFEHGSWFHGRLYWHRCDLSFDGTWLVYFALGPTRQHYSWVAVSRPPWLHAELFYPKGDTWHGGGVWLGPSRLWLNLPAATPARDGDRDPRELGLSIEWGYSAYGEDEGPFYRRLERDGWIRAGALEQGREERTKTGWLIHDDPGWVLQPRSSLPALRMVYRGYVFNQGRVFSYTLDDHPRLLDERVDWAGYDGAGRLVVARAGMVERYTRDDVERGEPSLRYDLTALTPPPPPPPRSHPAQPEVPQPGADAEGRYRFLGDPARLHAAREKKGHPIRTQSDLQAIASILREDRTWAFEKPQTYVVSEDGVFVLGGDLNEDVEVAGGQAVLAAGEAILEEGADGSWTITALNNRSYGYMPEAGSWAAVTKALRDTGIPYPHGFSELYPRDGTWAEVLAILRS